MIPSPPSLTLLSASLSTFLTSGESSLAGEVGWLVLVGDWLTWVLTGELALEGALLTVLLTFLPPKDLFFLAFSASSFLRFFSALICFLRL